MTDVFEVSQDALSDPALIQALRSKDRSPSKLELLTRLRRRLIENRTALEQQTERFNAAYEHTVGSALDANSLARLADAVLKAERGAREQLYPWMEALRHALLRRSEHAQEAQKCLYELHDVAVAWLTTYQTLREKLLNLAAERCAASGEILRARPVEGEIDYAELSREHIARYPKIRAALAK